MTVEELRSALQTILDEEHRPNIDWPLVEDLCLGTIKRLVSEDPPPDYPYDVVFHFLDDPDVRQKNGRYAEVQRQRVNAWLLAN
jgi:hypothetical protein